MHFSMPFVRSVVTAALTCSVLTAQGPTMGSAVDFLDFRITDAEYSEQLGVIVAVSGTPANRIHVYDPAAQSGTWAALPAAGVCVSVSPDGTRAAVGHNGWISLVDLRTVTVTETIAVTADVNDVVLAGNGFAYAFPRTGQWETVRCIELATGVETQSSGRSIYHGTKAKLHPNGTKIYGANNGLSPSDIEKYDIAAGTASYSYDSPYHGTYSMGGNLWVSEDGLRIFVRAGNIFRSSDIQAEDMTFNGSLSELTLVTWLDHSAEAGKVLAIPESGFISGAPDTELQVYDYQFLAHEGTFQLPAVTLGASSYPTHGRFVFFEADGNRAWVVVEADPTSGMLLDHGVVEFELGITTAPLAVDVEELSVTAGGVQSLSIDAGPAHGNMTYFVLGSINGTQPGFDVVPGVHLPLNFEMVYMVHTLTAPNAWPHYGTLGPLDSMGRGTATIDLDQGPVSPALAGLVLHHAYLVFDGDTPVFASNPVRLLLTP